jgi:hypothetical protein
MNVQSLAVAILVVACAVSAIWTLMPAAWRRRIAIASLGLPLPRPIAARMRAQAERASACGCDGCDQGAAKTPSAAQATNTHPITLHRRVPR